MEAAQFPSRYLEWIMIAREQSLDPGYSLNLSARADSLTEEEREEILSVRSYLVPECYATLCRHLKMSDSSR